MVAGKETDSSFLSAFVSPCVHCLHTRGTECCFQRLGEYMFVKWPFRLPGGDKNRCCQDKQVEDTPWDSEVRAWPLTTLHFPLWPRGPRRLRLNSGQRGSRAQALVAAGGPQEGMSRDLGHFWALTRSPPLLVCFIAVTPISAQTSRGEAAVFYGLTVNAPTVKRGPVPVSTVRATLWRRPCIGHTVDRRAGGRAGLLRCFAGSRVARAVRRRKLVCGLAMPFS